MLRYFRNVTFVMLQKCSLKGTAFFRVLYNGWVPLHYKTSYNELHNGFFNTLAQTSEYLWNMICIQLKVGKTAWFWRLLDLVKRDKRCGISPMSSRKING